MKSTRKFKKYLETNGNENTTIQNLWDTAKAALRGKFRDIQAFLKKEKISNNLTCHLKELEKREQSKPKVRASLVVQWLRVRLPM